MVLAVVAAIVAFAAIYFVLPQLLDLRSTLEKLRSGDWGWLVCGVFLEAGSLLGGSVMLRGVFARSARPINLRESVDVTLAGAAATKLLATAGAGGIALWTWALRGFGVPAPQVATGIICYEIVTYAFYMSSLVICGLGLWFGVFSGPAPFGLTVVPALFGLAVILIALSMFFIPTRIERFLLERADRSTGKRAASLRKAATVPRAVHGGMVQAAGMFRRRDRSVFGAAAYWGFDIAVLWAALHAFGHSPPGAVLVLAYFIGTLGNVLPLPGGVGGVEGGMIGALIGFGVQAQTAVLGVLAYRTISNWLPALPGAIAYVRLRRRLDALEN
jgi:uncharacterized protein (TIRG00374 family)